MLQRIIKAEEIGRRFSERNAIQFKSIRKVHCVFSISIYCAIAMSFEEGGLYRIRKVENLSPVICFCDGSIY